MKLRNLKYALLIGAYIGSNESYAAITTMAYDLQASAAAYTMNRAGAFRASVAGTYTGILDAASAVGAVAYIDSVNSLTMGAGTIGTAGTPVALAITSTATLTLATATLYGMPNDANGDPRGALQLMGGGTIAMTGAATAFTASTAGDTAFIDVLKSSTLDFSTTGFTLTANIVLEASQTLTINVDSGTATIDGIISGAGNIIKTGNGILKLTPASNGSNTYTGTNTCSAGALYLAPLQLVDSQTYSTAISIGSGIVQPVNISSGSATISSIISGVGQFQKLGAGIVALTGANTFTGKVLFGGNSAAAGTIVASHATALGSGSADITVGATAAGTLSVTSNFTSSRTLTLASTINLNVPSSAITATLSGVVSGAQVVTKSGLGKVTLSGANTNSSGITLSAGTLQLSNATAAGTGAITTSDATTIVFPSGTTTVANAITMGSGATTLSSTLVADTTTLSGVISGLLATLVKDGAGALTLTGANLYAGGTIMKSGKINVGVDRATTVSSALGVAGSTIEVSGASTLAFLGNYSLIAAQDVSVGAALIIEVAGGYTGIILGDITTNTAGIITKTGAGALTYTPTTGNNQTANTILSAGRISYGGTNTTLGSGNAVMAAGTTLTTNAGSRTIENKGNSAVTFTLG